MRFSWAAATAALLICGSAQAGPRINNQIDQDEDLTAGIGLICNTSQQVQRYVTLRADGAEVQNALHLVNEEARDPRACGLAAIIYKKDKTLETKSVQGKLVSIVRINIIGGYDGQQWSAVQPMVQYAMIEAEGYAI